MFKLQKLKEQKEQQQKAAAVSEEPKKEEGATNSSTPSADTFVLTKQNSKELAEIRKQKSKENVLSLRAKGAPKPKGRTPAAQLRAQKDIAEFSTVPGITVFFPDPNNIMSFVVMIKPSDGLYKSAEFKFSVNIPTSYPYDPPKVLCETPIYHPNIDTEGHVCLNILREDWTPVLNLGSVLFGLMTLFLEPNPGDPLNKEAAKLMIEKPAEFEKNVKQALRGGWVAGRQFPKLIS